MGVIAFGFFDGAGLIAVERGVLELAACGYDLCERVVELEVVPEDGGGLQVAVRRAGMHSAHAPPEGRGLGELLRCIQVEACSGAVRVDIADGSEAVEVGGLGGGEMLFDLDGAVDLLRVEVRERAEDAGGFVPEDRVGGVGVGELAEQRSALLKVRLPQVDLGELARGGWIVLLCIGGR